MARRVQPDQIQANININASQAQEEIRKLESSTKGLQSANDKLRKEIARLQGAEGDHTEEIKRLNAAIAENNKQINDNKKAIEEQIKAMDLSQLTTAQLKKRLKEVKKELENTSKAADPERYKELQAELERTKNALSGASTGFKGFFQRLTGGKSILEMVKGGLVGLGMVLVNSIVGTFKQIKGIIVEFEKANAKLAAVLGTNIAGVKRLTDQARLLGRTTSATASEVTGLQVELAKLGFTQIQIEHMTAATLRFAKAVDTDLASAAAFAGAAMRMFDKDSSQAESVLASLAVATTKSALDFSKLESSLATVGPVANSFGFSLEDTVALLGILANAGFDASSAATATRNILLNLCDANGDLAQALGQPVTNLEQLMGGLNQLNAEGIDLAKALELTDKRSVAAFATMLKGTDDALALRDAITGCEEGFNQMSKTMADTGAGSEAGFDSALEGMALSFFGWRDAIKSVYDSGVDLVNLITVFLEDAGIAKALVVATKVTFDLLSGAIKLTVQVVRGFILGLKRFFELVGELPGVQDTIESVARGFKALVNGISVASDWLKKLFDDATGTSKALEETAEKTTYLTEATERYKKAMEGVDTKLAVERDRLEELRKVAMSELEPKEKRIEAIKTLNAIIPHYNAQLDDETGKYRENKKALDDYLTSLEKKLRLEAAKDRYKELLKADNEAREAYYKKWKNNSEAIEAMAEATGADWLAGAKYSFNDFYAIQKTEQAQALDEFKLFMKDMGLAVEDFAESTQKEVGKVKAAAGDASVNRLKEIDAELKKLRKTDPQSDEELDRIQKRIKLLQAERKELLGNAKTKREAGTYEEDSLDRVTAPIDEKHQRRTLDINKQTPNMSAPEATIAKSKELIRYCSELTAALETLKSETNATHTQTIDKINKQLADLSLQTQQAEQAIAAAQFDSLRDDHDKQLQTLEEHYSDARTLTAQYVADQKITQEAADLYLLGLERKLHRDQLTELERYYQEVKNSDLIHGEEKQKVLDDLAKQIRQAWSAVVTDSGKWQEAFRNMSQNPEGLEALKQSNALKVKATEEAYNAMIEMARQEGIDVTTLEEEKQRRLAALNYQYREDIYKLQESLGLSWAEQYDRELAALENMHNKGLISESQYQKAKLKMQMQNVSKYADFFQQTTGSMVSAMQEAEIAQSEAKYDVLIQQAKNNGEDTAALEEEKENEKLKIQKKYADVDFAVKIAQIISSTAMAIMTAFAQLGPIGGGIAAAMLTATGAAQVATAKAERDKVKNMQPSNTAKSSTAKAERALSGYAEGGYTGDGDRYEVAGVVHRGEYVVPKPIMSHPMVIDAVGAIESIRLNRRRSAGVPASPVRGYAEGGYVEAVPEGAMVTAGEFAGAVADLRAAIKSVECIRAYVVYSDITKAKATMDAADYPFTIKK